MNIELLPFDKEFFESLSDHEMIKYREDGKFHTVLVDGEKAGIVGFLPSKRSEDEGFVQIVLAKSFRGHGLAKEAEDLLAQKYGLKRLYATIIEENSPSINSHLNSGFVALEDAEMNKLRQADLLAENEIRLVKEY